MILLANGKQLKAGVDVAMFPHANIYRIVDVTNDERGYAIIVRASARTNMPIEHAFDVGEDEIIFERGPAEDDDDEEED